MITHINSYAMLNLSRDHLYAFPLVLTHCLMFYLIIEIWALLINGLLLIISLHNFCDCPQYVYIVKDLCYFRDNADSFCSHMH